MIPLRPELIADVTRWCDTATLLELATVLGAIERELLARRLPGTRSLQNVRDDLISLAEAYAAAKMPEPSVNRQAQRN